MSGPAFLAYVGQVLVPELTPGYNDAPPDKSLKTDELYQAIAIGYAVTWPRARRSPSPSPSPPGCCATARRATAGALRCCALDRASGTSVSTHFNLRI